MKVDTQYDNLSAVLQETGKFLIKFGASWCMPCKTFDRSFDQFANQYAESADQFTYVHVDLEDPSCVDVDKWGMIRTVPSFFTQVDGVITKVALPPSISPSQLNGKLIEYLNLSIEDLDDSISV